MEYKNWIDGLDNKKIIKIKGFADRRFHLYIEPVRDDEEFIIAVDFCEYYGKNTIPELWFKNGYTNKVLNKYMCISTYCRDKDGIFSAKFNPQIKGIHEIDFDYMLESNQENLKKLIDKTIEMYVENIKELWIGDCLWKLKIKLCLWKI